MSADTLKLLADEDLRRSFGQKGRELAVQRYSTDKIIPQYIAYYEKIINSAQLSAVSSR
jgi:glycosyltransferase involved in cell wall biosynthesis